MKSSTVTPIESRMPTPAAVPADVRLGAARALLERAANGADLALPPETERQLRARLAAGDSFVSLAAAFCEPGGLSLDALTGHLWRLALGIR